MSDAALDAAAGRVIAFQLGLARRGFDLSHLVTAGSLFAAQLDAALPAKHVERLARTALETVGAVSVPVQLTAPVVVAEIGKVLGLKHSATYSIVERAIRRGELHVVDYGDTKKRFDRAEVERWLAGRLKGIAHRPKQRKHPKRPRT